MKNLQLKSEEEKDFSNCLKIQIIKLFQKLQELRAGV